MSKIKAKLEDRGGQEEWCGLTYATLRVLSENLSLAEIESRVGLARTGGGDRGEIRTKTGNVRDFSMWRLSSSVSSVASRDTRDHIDWILAKVAGHERAFAELSREGCVVDCLVRWDSILGHGGPIFMPDQLRRLADLDAVLWLDVFVDSD